MRGSGFRSLHSDTGAGDGSAGTIRQRHNFDDDLLIAADQLHKLRSIAESMAGRMKVPTRLRSGRDQKPGADPCLRGWGRVDAARRKNGPRTVAQ